MNQYYLQNVLEHIIRGQALCNETSSPSPDSRDNRRSPGDRVEEAKGPRVLVVDDNFFCRNVLARLLQKHDARSTLCEDGTQALEAVKRGQEFDLAVVDYHMPLMDGITLIQSIRDFERTVQVPSPLPILCNALYKITL